MNFLILSLLPLLVVSRDFDDSSCSSSEESGGGGPHRPPGGGGGGGGDGRGCPSGWLRFRRPSGVWCVLVGHRAQADGMLTQAAAEAICQSHGATLTGFQNYEERMAVANEGLKHIATLKKLVGGLWVGATNNAGCKEKSCGPLGTFRWTDGSTSGTSGFGWGTGEPDNLNWPGATACIQQLIMHPSFATSNDGLAAWRTNFKHGDLDKYQCTTPAGPAARLYACGKRGSR
ncbi:hypothetical protein GCK72_019730 [Caenorhabditis remanei]|uniref:C-type lectin domain-containing protein n=1 Tax=Caenorhabditis remanei TaxID=31234 RepID=A0A6A5GEK7_CAERE|nr:hypothetical protein GCK72_019730 [Caenorhabditis remanei]KAF1753174.1 hypothetical protein GCK72_019730 [Caenorhabditis remanei]